jgi:hypothetical protein
MHRFLLGQLDPRLDITVARFLDLDGASTRRHVTEAEDDEHTQDNQDRASAVSGYSPGGSCDHHRHPEEHHRDGQPQPTPLGVATFAGFVLFLGMLLLAQGLELLRTSEAPRCLHASSG